MAEIKLFPYQQDFVSNIRSAMSKYPHILGVMPCGGGKSFCIADIAKKAVNKGSRVLILSHRLVLLRQNNESIIEYGLQDMVVFNDERTPALNGLLYCSSLQTLRSRMKEVEYMDFVSSCDLILIDEAHLMYANFLFESSLVDNVRIIGFTGSPKRIGSQRQLGIDWDIIIPSISVKELEEMGRLVPLRYFVVPDDISGIKIDNITGDFQTKSAYKHYDTPEKYSGVVDQYLKHANGKQFICFGVSIAHVIKLTVALNEAGIKSAYTISNISEPAEPKETSGISWERYINAKEVWDLHLRYNKYSIHQTKVKSALSTGRIQGVVCISILTIGFDYKPLECVIIARATQSLPLLIQILGRGERCANNKKEAIILDMGTNIQRLGKAEDDRDWSLWHETSDSVGIPASKECPLGKKDSRGNKGCGRVNLASADICKCGHRFENHKEEKKAELIELVGKEPKSFKDMSVSGLIAYASLNKYKKNWIWHQLWIRAESEKQFRDDMREMGYKNPFIYRLQADYKSRK